MNQKSNIGDAVARAEKKLRQAEFFVGHLEYLSKQPSHREPGNPEHLEFFFSASLTAAQSVYYVLAHSGRGIFQKVYSKWLKNLSEQQSSFFKKMKKLRDNDVHHASTVAESLPKYVEVDFSRHESPYYQPSFYNAALFGSRPMIEEQNPDGEMVSGHVLRGSIGLYIKQEGKYVDASTACRQFIGQLRSLLGVVKGKT
jgi:hypothetical protein